MHPTTGAAHPLTSLSGPRSPEIKVAAQISNIDLRTLAESANFDLTPVEGDLASRVLALIDYLNKPERGSGKAIHQTDMALLSAKYGPDALSTALAAGEVTF